jgi:transcriptional regulator with XRE-family HTH domain
VEFCEKLQELRKSRGLTQEELAEALYVSRTAVSKWESGRGYPSIDSLKEISNYFSVTIDELLSGEKLIFIAEKENKSNIRNICDLLFGAADLLSFLLIVLPLYPKTVEGYIYSVNLWMYTETAAYNRMVYWVLFLALMASGVIKILQTQLKTEKGQKTVTMCSVFLSIGTVLYLVLARETYAAAVAFLLMIMKGLLVFRHIKSD